MKTAGSRAWHGLAADAARLFVPIARERVGHGREPGTYLVCTVHREANVRPDRLARIVDGLNRLSEPIVFPAHPRTRAALEGVAASGYGGRGPRTAR